MYFEPQKESSECEKGSEPEVSGCLNGETECAVTCSCCEKRTQQQHNINLAMISEELERRTQETQKLQEEVEHATRFTLERMGRSLGSCNTEISGNSMCTNHESEAPPEFGVNSLHSCSMNSGVDVTGASWLNIQSRDVFERALKDYSEQVSELQKQLREECEQRELLKFYSHQSIIKLESKLKKCQTEKDTMANFRLKESQKHAKLLEQLQAAQLELHLLKQNEGHEVMETEDRVKTFERRGEIMAEILQDIFNRLSDYEKRSGECTGLRYDRASSPCQLSLGDAVEKAIKDLEHGKRDLQEKLQMAERQLIALKEQAQGQGKTVSLEQEYKENIKQLITGHEQKVAMLNEKLNSSQTHADILQNQVEALQQQIQSQTLSHQTEMRDMKCSLSLLSSELLEKQNCYIAKVNVLEEALAQAKSQAEHVQRERDLLSQQAEEQDIQLCRITTELWQTSEKLCLERQQRSILEQHSHSVQQFENIVRSLKEQCQRHLNLQEQNSGETRRLQALLDKRDAELPLKQQEVQQSRAQVLEAHTLVQALQTEVELLRLRLEDGKKNSDLLVRPLVALQQERKNLTRQLEQLRLDNQQLRAALLEAELRLSALEQEKSQQQAALSERTNDLHHLTLEKQQVMVDLEHRRKKFDQLKEEQESSREELLRKIEGLQLQNSRLQAQRNNIRNDLEKAKITIRAQQGADEHGLKIALGIQKQVTAKREQVDLLQSRVQILEEITEKLTQEKNYQVMKCKRQAQELLFELERRKRLETEMEAYHTTEKLLKSEKQRLETALHKMSDSFAECQEYIQKQQQEIMRLKLQHTLELKEGQNLRSTSARIMCEQGQDLQATNNICISPPTSHTPPVPPVLPEVPYQAHSACQELNVTNQKCGPILELRSLDKELTSVTDMEQSPDTDNSSSRFMETHRNRKKEVTENPEGEIRQTRPSASYK